MKLSLLLGLVAFLGLTQSCILSKNGFDKQNVRKINKNKFLIPEISALAISQLGDKHWTEIHVDSLFDKSLKRKIKKLGKFTSIYVNTTDSIKHTLNEPYDSIVTFNRTSFFLGVEELIFDYSKQNRTYPDNLNTTNDYKFLKLDDRVYYRRRPFPWM